ncbi:MAG TPA: hypothetical protein VFC67_12945 [Prolixibacteraceae bacterium]|nr:hypothetical protein [Prolixibacteraceae bacterium]
MEDKLLNILKSSKLDLTKLYLIPEYGGPLNKSNFEICPKDFLRFAKQDLKAGDEHGYINSLTNSKRAIDCQIDEAMENLGIKSNKFNPEFNEFLKLYNFEEDIPVKLKIIHIINLAPSLIISKTRTLRNKLEHIYQKPKLSEVKDALDVADLFIRSIEGKFNGMLTDFYFTDENNHNEENGWKTIISLNISFDTDKLHFKITLKRNKKTVLEEIFIDSNDKEFCGLLGVMISSIDQIEVEDSLKILLKFIGHPIPSQNVSIELG